ncbi:hypothetical protein [Kibdelosporangium aridum]|nr:hypothetical protein [Kibdelosporangium aridum]
MQVYCIADQVLFMPLVVFALSATDDVTAPLRVVTCRSVNVRTATGEGTCASESVPQQSIKIIYSVDPSLHQSTPDGGTAVVRRPLIFIEALLIVATVTVFVVQPFGISAALGWISLGVCGAVFILNFYVPHEWGSRLKDTALGRAAPEDVDNAAIVRAEQYVDETYPLASVDYFCRMLTHLPSYLARVDERFELDGRTAVVQTRLIYRRISTAKSRVLETTLKARTSGNEGTQSSQETVPEPATVLVPLVSIKKGLLFDRFEAFDESGKNLATLTQWEVRGLLMVTLRALFIQALVPDAKRSLTKDDRHVLLNVAKFTVCATRGRDRVLAQRRRAKALRLIDNLSEDRFDTQKKASIRSFCESLSDDYLIVVELPMPTKENFAVSYRHVVTAAEVSIGPEQRARAKHGLLPVVVDAPMTWALRPDSYHFELVAPPGQYVYDHHLERLESNKHLTQQDFCPGGVQQYVRLHHEQGRSQAHLYIRKVRYPTSETGQVPDFKSIIRFREIPPGALGSAVTVALVTALLISFYTFFYSGRPMPPSIPAQAILTLLLALPAFLAGGLGRSITSDALARTSLFTFYGLWTIVMTSLLGVGLFLADVNKHQFLNYHFPLFGHMQTANTLWTILAMASFAMYLMLRKEKSDQRRYYLRITKRAAIARKQV